MKADSKPPGMLNSHDNKHEDGDEAKDASKKTETHTEPAGYTTDIMMRPTKQKRCRKNDAVIDAQATEKEMSIKLMSKNSKAVAPHIEGAE